MLPTRVASSCCGDERECSCRAESVTHSLFLLATRHQCCHRQPALLARDATRRADVGSPAPMMLVPPNAGADTGLLPHRQPTHRQPITQYKLAGASAHATRNAARRPIVLATSCPRPPARRSAAERVPGAAHVTAAAGDNGGSRRPSAHKTLSSVSNNAEAVMRMHCSATRLVALNVQCRPHSAARTCPG